MVRKAVGICDVSTLGKIDIQGPDAGQVSGFRLLQHVFDAEGRSRQLWLDAARGRVRHG